ncbi:MAG: TIGR01212 family radical SAM protein [Bacilli bacterium]|nr:TIGR01212 family radical SAM protein [Bacilli bacterium]MBN2876611.1 TIGR01212 family radical SAM protein [Bacilli bacterium]
MNYFTTEKRFNTVNEFYRRKFGAKVYKITLNGDFTCPNRDGTLSSLGCIYCSESGSGDFAGNSEHTLERQFQEIRQLMEHKWSEGRFIAYFQANTNTYGPIEKLKSLFETAILLHPDIVGLSIATRPDCLPDDVLDYLEDLNQRTYLTIELGLQSIHEKTMEFINRGHDLKTFEDAVKKLRERNINVVVHIINSLPGETREDMLATARYLNQLDIQGVKIHMLFIQKNTQLAHIYQENPFPLLSRDEYVEVVVRQLELLNDSIIIHRLTGDAPRNELIEPKWSLKKFVVANEIDKLMRAENTYQGSRSTR